jgi:hypothetical protein
MQVLARKEKKPFDGDPSKGFTSVKIGATGFEPASDCKRTDCVDCGYADCDMCRVARALQSGDLTWLDVALHDAELRKVLIAWHGLPESFRKALLALVESQV